MKVVKDLAQGSSAWHTFRLQGLGGSDAPAVLGVSPYKTPYQLAREKCGLKNEQDEQDNEFIFAKGHATEKLIRKEFQELMKVDMNPICVISDKYDFIQASLDGFDPKHGVLEAKLVGKEVLKTALEKGEIPVHHFAQLQHQLFVTGADVGQWFGHNGKDQGALIEVKADKEYTNSLVDKEITFWDLVRTRNLPPLSDLDYLIPEDEKLLLELREAKELAENASLAYEAMKSRVLETYKHPKISGAGLIIYRTIRDGSVAVKDIPEVQEVLMKLEKDYLDKFKGKGSTSFTVKFKKEK